MGALIKTNSNFKYKMNNQTWMGESELIKQKLAELELARMHDPLEAVVKSAISNPDCSIDLEYLQHALHAGYSFYFIRHRIWAALNTNLYHLPPKKLFQPNRAFVNSSWDSKEAHRLGCNCR